MNKRLTVFSRWVALISALLLIGVLFLPIWKIELSAPQYPEGLVLKIYAGKLGGNIEVVNGLNHYIGMRTLHEKDFVEFTVLPWIIGGFVVLGMAAAFSKRRWLVLTWAAAYLLFALLAMVDFYYWEYNYGHQLDPAAPIQVPGMSYQPPLIGYKQLLNFGAFSIPDLGGWIFIGVGVLLGLVLIQELRTVAKKTKRFPATMAAAVILCLFVSGCTTQPQPVQFGHDGCDFCKMTILDAHYGGEVVTKKGRVYKFDDAHCITSFLQSNIPETAVAGVYLLDYLTSNLVKADRCYLLNSDELHSPMGGNTAAFVSETDRLHIQQQFKGRQLTWNEYKKSKP